MTPRFCLLAAALCFTVPLSARAGGEPRPAVHREGDYFEATIPDGWKKKRSGFGLSQEKKKVYGITLQGRAPAGTAPGDAPNISAQYYAPGNLLDATAEKFIRVHSSPAPEGAKLPPLPKAGSVGGLKAEIFSKVTVSRGGSHQIEAAKVETWEAFAVVPLKSGYYVLRYSAPPAGYADGLAVFEAFIAAFKPLLK